MKLNINKDSIWMDAGKPRCSPRSIDETLNDVQRFIRSAEEWAAAAEEYVDATRNRPPKEEKQIQALMKMLGLDRAGAIRVMKEDPGF
jgi:hypothetical protein